MDFIITQDIENLSNEKGKDLDKNYTQYFAFKVGDDIFGININQIREVNEYNRIFPVPKTPPYIKGNINLRGEVVPVIDLSTRFFGKSSDTTKFTCIIIVELKDGEESMLIGLVIDSFKEVLSLKDNEIEDTPSFGLSIRNDFVSGVGSHDDNIIVLLDVDALLNINDLAGYSKL